MKKFIGLVVSNKNKNTAIVEVTRFLVHPLYEKRMKRTKRYPTHDEIGVNLGDKVLFVESRPYSKTKRWKITTTLVKAGTKEGKESTDHGLQSTAKKKAVVSRRKTVVK
ncbi:MAG: 30S ribosomal protein S17 [Candidatus Blackburnbacteria bacterium]|nr:30S ribosomal protein S17 [Candidatus Blackburnbacteria bacterium]